MPSLAMSGRVVNKVLPEVMLTRKSLTAWVASLGPKLKVLAQLGTVWRVFVEVARVWLPELLKLGWSLTGLTLISKDLVTVPLSASVTVTLMLAVPLALAMGV